MSSERWLIALVRLLGLLVGGALIVVMPSARTAEAQPLSVKVRVIIEKVLATDDFEGGGGADFYARVTIDGQEFSNKGETAEEIEDNDDISPNWEFSKLVDISRGSIPIFISIHDEDGAFRLDDEEADITPGDGLGLPLTLTLAPCGITGDASLGGTCVNGQCACSTPPIVPGAGKIIVSKGPDVKGDSNRARIEFRVVVEEPPSSPGRRVRCSHSPIWPQPTDRVTITAASLDGALNANIADNIEIWVNSNTAPALAAGGTTLTHTVGPFPAGSMSYACRAVDDGVPVFSGWRTLSVGNPAQGRAVPVLTTGSQVSRIDLVFMPDSSTYTGGASDPVFLADVGNIIQAYYSEDIYLIHQDQVNFWIGLDAGQAKNGCESEAPDNWDDDYTFADAGAIVHRNGPTFRDCAPGGDRFFSGDATRMDGGRLARVFLHETGHRPFGLADEYCSVVDGKTVCDGGYFQSEPFPNVYAEPSDCADDAPNLGRTAAACREFEDDGFWFFSKDWSVSDPTSNDLMVDNLTPQGADVRRMNWMFDQCAASRC